MLNFINLVKKLNKFKYGCFFRINNSTNLYIFYGKQLDLFF